MVKLRSLNDDYFPTDGRQELPLIGGTWEPCEVPLDKEGGVYEDPRKSEMAAVVYGTVNHVCAGLDGSAIESSTDFEPCVQISASEEEIFNEDPEEADCDSHSETEDDEPSVRVNGLPLSEYLDLSKKTDHATARVKRVFRAKHNIFGSRKCERGFRNMKKRNRGQKPYRPWEEHRRDTKKVSTA
jgi:hypothetical protein